MKVVPTTRRQTNDAKTKSPRVDSAIEAAGATTNATPTPRVDRIHPDALADRQLANSTKAPPHVEPTTVSLAATATDSPSRPSGSTVLVLAATQNPRGVSPPRRPSQGGEAVNEIATPLAFRELHPMLTETWTVHFRVVSRDTQRTWENLSGSGVFFAAYLIDAAGDLIKLTVFNEGVDKFAEVLVCGSVCRLSGGKIKFANATFSDDNCELTIDQTATVCRIDDPVLVRIEYSGAVSTVKSLAGASVRSKMCVFAVAHKSDGVKRLKTARGKPCVKRDVLFVDATMMKIVCTFWGVYATEAFDTYAGKPVLLRGVQIAEFNGSRTLNAGVGSTVLFDPSCPEAERLRTWYVNLRDDATFTTTL